MQLHTEGWPVSTIAALLEIEVFLVCHHHINLIYFTHPCKVNGADLGLLHLFSPERITLGGGVALAMAWLEPHIQRIIATRALPSYRDVPIHYAQLRDQAGVIGAATWRL